MPAPLAPLHFCTPTACEGGYGNKCIVECGNKEYRKTHDQQDDLGSLHVLIAPIGIPQRGNLGRISERRFSLRRTILVHHGIHAAVHRLSICAGLQADVLRIGVSPVPRIVTQLGRPRWRHRDDGIGLHRGVVRQVGIGAAHGEVALVVVADDLADGVLSAKHSPRQGFAEVNDVGLLEVLHGIARQHLDTHRAEEEGVGGNLRLVETGVAIVERLGSHPAVGAGGRLHLFGEALEDGTRHGAGVLLLPVQLLALDGELRPHLVEAVVVLETRVITLLERHAGEEQDAHGQSQAQGHDLQQVAPLGVEQGADDVMECLHIVVFLLFSYPC